MQRLYLHPYYGAIAYQSPRHSPIGLSAVFEINR